MTYLSDWIEKIVPKGKRKTHMYLLKSLIKTEFRNKYKTRKFGILWAILEPLCIIGVLLFVFTKLFDFQNPQFPEYMVIGFFVWEFFEAATRSGLNCIYANAPMLRKHSFPKWIIVLGNTTVSFIDFLFKFVALILILFTVSSIQDISRILLNWNMLLVPILTIILFVLILGVNMITSIIFVKFHDLESIWSILMRAGFFATPIVYPKELLPAQYDFLHVINPVLYPMTLFRQILLEPTNINYGLFVPAIFLGLGFFIIGVVMYKDYGPKLPEWV